MKDGTVFNPAPVCQVPRCTDKSAARMVDVTIPQSQRKRKDVCKKHALVSKRVFRDDIDIVATWNGLTMEDFDD